MQELAAQTRVIVRQSNPAVGRAITSAIPRGLVVNPADLAAPTFVESVLDERLHRMQIAGDDYAVREVEAGVGQTARPVRGIGADPGYPPRRDDCGLPES